MPNIGLVYALSAGADSIRTCDQSASSSSASSMGNDVVTPWPISERSTTTRTLSSAPMRSQALGANAAAAAFAPNAWLRIGADESVLVVVDRSEMGQGVTTSLPMLLAEEL